MQQNSGVTCISDLHKNSGTSELPRPTVPPLMQTTACHGEEMDSTWIQL